MGTCPRSHWFRGLSIARQAEPGQTEARCSGGMGPEMIAAIVASLGLAGGSVAGLWRIAQTLGRYEGSTAKVLEQLSNIVSDHETRLRSLERSDGLS